MRAGDWVRLGATLSFDEGLYKILDLSPRSVTVRGEDGRRHCVSLDQLATLMKAPATATRRFAKKINFFKQDVGMLAAADYHVGNSGHDKTRRRAILSWVFEALLASLPKVGTDEYRSEWGESRSIQRFHKITNCLLSFAQNALGRREWPREAIEDWQDDYRWFIETYGASIGQLEPTMIVIPVA